MGEGGDLHSRKLQFSTYWRNRGGTIPHITPTNLPVAKPGISMGQCKIEMYTSSTMTNPHHLEETWWFILPPTPTFS